MHRAKHAHDDLRRALIDAGVSMLEDGNALTLRGAAMRAGVSHAAPAHHFDGLDGLKTAIAAEGLRRFTDALAASQDDPDRSAFDNLVAMGKAYCNFADDHLQLFHVMFVASEVDREDEEIVMEQLAAYSHLRAVCAPFVPDPSQAWLIENSVWSMTHGYALLQMENPFRNDASPIKPPPLAAQFALLLGLPAPAA